MTVCRASLLAWFSALFLSVALSGAWSEPARPIYNEDLKLLKELAAKLRTENELLSSSLDRSDANSARLQRLVEDSRIEIANLLERLKTSDEKTADAEKASTEALESLTSLTNSLDRLKADLFVERWAWVGAVVVAAVVGWALHW